MNTLVVRRGMLIARNVIFLVAVSFAVGSHVLMAADANDRANQNPVPVLNPSPHETGALNLCDDPLYRKQGEIAVKYIDFQISSMDINLRKFAWQDRASEVVLWLVVVVTVAGLGFSGYQLYVSATVGSKTTNSTLEISIHRIRVQTAVTGIAVLVISLVFLYMFLVKVYDIKFVDLNAPGLVAGHVIEK